jgi:hypothetical protein
VGAGVPPFPVTFGGLFDPALWDTPVTDVVTLAIPDEALPGTYVAAVKARRDYAGEALNRAATISIQVGTATPTQYTLSRIACTTCHTGPSELRRLLHGLNDRRACYGATPHSKSNRMPPSTSAYTWCTTDRGGFQGTRGTV